MILGIRPSDFEDADVWRDERLPVIEVTADVVEDLGRGRPAQRRCAAGAGRGRRRGPRGRAHPAGRGRGDQRLHGRGGRQDGPTWSTVLGEPSAVPLLRPRQRPVIRSVCSRRVELTTTGTTLPELETPALLIDLDALETELAGMAAGRLAVSGSARTPDPQVPRDRPHAAPGGAAGITCAAGRGRWRPTPALTTC